MATSQDFVNWVCGPRLEPDYLKYILLAERDSLVRFASGTTHQTIYYPEAKAFHVLLPPRPEQLKILQVLRSLDERAKLNDATGSTLESLARSLFHNWFIEFEPVHANASGSGKSSAGKKAKFFPASFIESQLGTIPAGWNVIKLSEILTVEKGLSYKGAFLSSDGLPLVNLGCFLGNGRFDITALKGYTGPYKEKHVVRPGDLVVANTDITQKRTVLGSPGIVFAEDGRDELLFSHHTYAVRLDPKYVDLRLYVYYQMLSDAFRDRAKGFATGTTVLALPREAILDYELVLPPRGIITSFNQIVEPIKNRQIAGALQSITLRRMRDTLLPKLLSGEVRVP